MAGNIDFITSNPATDAYNKAEELALKAQRQDQLMRSSIREENEALQTQPARMRRIEADASLTETRAQTAKDEAPYAAPMAATRLRQAKATAKNSENAWFRESVDRLDKGDIEGAKALAAQYGHNIPEEYVNDADMRAALKEAITEAEKQYPKREADQRAYVRGRMELARKSREEGKRASGRPEYAYNVPGAPEPQETSDFRSRFEMLPTTRPNPETGQPETGYLQHDRSTGDTDFVSGYTHQGKGGLRSAGVAGQTLTIIKELLDRGHSYEQALALAQRAPNADQNVLRTERLALDKAQKVVGPNLDGSKNFEKELAKARADYGLPPFGASAPSRVGPVGPNERITGVTSTPAPVVQPGTGPARPSNGDGGKPLNMEAPPLPPNLPTGVQYSWSAARRQFRDELGRTYDETGRLISQ